MQLKQTPITREGQPEPVAASLFFGEEHPWFREMAENLRRLGQCHKIQMHPAIPI